MIKQNTKSSPNLSRPINRLLCDLECPKMKVSSGKNNHHSPSISQIKKQMRTVWKDPGHCSTEFSKFNAIKEIRLSEWERARVNIPERSYKYPKDFKGLKTDAFSRQFKSPYKSYSTKKAQNNKNFKIYKDMENQQFLQKTKTVFSKTLKFHCPTDKLFGYPSTKTSFKYTVTKPYHTKN